MFSSKNIFIEKGYFILLIFIGVLSSVATVGIAFILAAIIDTIQTASYDQLWHLGKLTILVLGLGFLVQWLSSKAETAMIYRINTRLKTLAAKKLDDMDLVHYGQKDMSYNLNLFTEDLNQINNEYLKLAHRVYVQAITCIASLAALIYISLPMAIIFVGIVFVTGLVPSLFSGLLQQKSIAYSQQSKNILASLNEVLTGYFSYKRLGLSGLFTHFQDKNEALEKARAEKNLWDYIIQSLIGSLAGLGQMVCMFAGAILAIRGDITAGTLIGAVQLLNSVFSPVQLISRYQNQMKANLPIREKFLALLNDTQESKALFTSLQQGIFLDKYSLELGEKLIINQLTYSFNKENSYLIMGGSGSGKSTLAKAILGYYEDPDNRICYDQVPVHDLDKISLYKQVRYLPSENFMFTGSVAENICLSRTIDQKKLLQEANKVGFDENFLNRQLSQENIVELSSGEQKRIALLRTVIDQPSVVILDEPTANLDKESAEKIKAYIQALECDLKIVISHDNDPSFRQSFDHILDITKTNNPINQ